jgi:hypothetical protein
LLLHHRAAIRSRVDCRIVEGKFNALRVDIRVNTLLICGGDIVGSFEDDLRLVVVQFLLLLYSVRTTKALVEKAYRQKG